jgi:hypothetical protein
MKIAVIGAGNVGKALGFGWANKGHQINFGVRESDNKKFHELIRSNVSVTSVENAVAFAEVIVFTTPYAAVSTIAKEIGTFGEKILIDATNPINADFSGLLPLKTSASEELAEISGSKFVVKCFNTVGFNIMENPAFGDSAATMLYCGDDTEAKNKVHQLASDIGFSPIDAGPLLQSRWLEAFAWLWISMAMKFRQGREIAFILNKR